MPLYDFHCKACDRMDVAYRHISRRNEPAQCKCGEPMERVILAPAVQPDLPGYESPVTGQWIEGKSARREDLRRTGCRPYEDGERQDFQRQKAHDEKKFEKSMHDAIARQFYALPEQKRRQLTRG